MIDIHCHIIPAIDDGSKDLASSIGQLLAMDAGGITHAFLTSHYLKGHYEYSREEYMKKLEELQQALKAKGAKLKLIPGFEVFLSPTILEDVKEKNLTLGDSKYVLIETELNGLYHDFEHYTFDLLRAGYKPILAHAERYVSVMRKPSSVRSLIERNVYVQVNTGSLVGQYGEKVRQTAWILIDNGWAHLLGSDDHVRGPYRSYFEAVEKIKHRIDEHTARLLSREHPLMVLNGEDMPYKYVHVERPRHRSKSGGFWRSIFG
jgi:protein-tyrosine phosphatase